jgi:hypothetical protein
MKITETTPGTDPREEQADFDAVMRHAFGGEPLDSAVARRVHERAAEVTAEIRRTHGELDEETVNRLLREVRDE